MLVHFYPHFEAVTFFLTHPTYLFLVLGYVAFLLCFTRVHIHHNCCTAVARMQFQLPRKVSRRSEIQHSVLGPVGPGTSSSSYGIPTTLPPFQSAASPAGHDSYPHSVPPPSEHRRRRSSHSQALSPLEQYHHGSKSPSVAGGPHEAWSDEHVRYSHANNPSSATRIDEHRLSEPWSEAQTSVSLSVLLIRC